MTTELIEERFVITGTQQAAANYAVMAQGLGNVAKGSADAQRSMKDASAGFGGISIAAKGAAGSFVQFSSAANAAANDGVGNLVNKAKGAAITLGQVANAAQGMIPGLNGMGAAVVRASSVIGSLSTMIGAGGPLAIGVGVAVAAVGVLSVALKDQKKTVEEDAEAVKELAAEWARVDDLARRAAENQPGAVARRAEAARRAADTRRTALAGTGFFAGGAGSPVAYGAAETIESVNAAEKAAAAAGKIGENVTEKSVGTRVPAFDPYKAEVENQARIRALDAQMRDQRLRERDREIATAGAARRGETSAYIRQLEEQSAARARAEKEGEDAYKRREQMIGEHYSSIRDVGMQAYSAIGGAVASALGAAIVGEDISTKKVLKGIGQQAATMGVLNLLQAPVDLFWNPPKAAAEFAAGAAEVALGAALGAAAGGGSSSGGGGGGGGGTPVVPQFAQNTGPSFGNPTAGGTTVIYQFPSIIAPTYREGQLGKQADEERRRQGR